tara:strand:+ start:5335 stop:5985 length:651 start_codon:yes stop_codon:yes gene_type:complete
MNKLIAFLALAILPATAQDRPYWYGVPAAGYQAPTSEQQAPAEQPVQGQPPLEDYSTNPIDPKSPIDDPTCPCFSGRWEFGVFAAGLFPEGADGEVETNYDDAAGGGITVGYWFSENVGLEYSGAWYGTQQEVHNSVVDLVLRWPNTYKCLAPYVFAGAGVHADDSSVGLYRLGAGFDIRFRSWSCAGLFIDAMYSWTEDNVQDYAIGRVGMRIPF